MLLSGGHYVLLSDVEFVLLSVRMLYNIVGAQLVLLSAPAMCYLVLVLILLARRPKLTNGTNANSMWRFLQSCCDSDPDFQSQ